MYIFNVRVHIFHCGLIHVADVTAFLPQATDLSYDIVKIWKSENASHGALDG
jgi:hypothetical protein